MTDAAAPSAPARASGPYSGYVLGVLFTVYMFNFIDRQIVAILQEPIKAEFGLADWQLGLMTGSAFAIFYSILGVPIAFAADRTNRVTIISLALTAWSALTAIFGLAQSYVWLLIARIGVGVGEAGGSPPSHSLISDYFDPKRRATALAFYSFGIPVGSVLGLWMGAFFYHWFAGLAESGELGAALAGLGLGRAMTDFLVASPWRLAFLVVGLPGVFLALLVKFTVREPVRGGRDGGRASTPLPLGEVLRALAKKPSFWLLSLGAAVASFVGYGLFPWLPSYFIRTYNDPSVLADPVLLSQAVRAVALPYGAMIFVGGVIGTWAGGYVCDRFGEKDERAYATLPAYAMLAAVPIYWVGISLPSVGAALTVLTIPTALGAMWYGPLFATIQNLVAPGMRALASAIMLFIVNLIGLGLGQLVTGALSDLFSLKIAILAVGTCYLLAGVFFLLAARTLREDWER